MLRKFRRQDFRFLPILRVKLFGEPVMGIPQTGAGYVRYWKENDDSLRRRVLSMVKRDGTTLNRCVCYVNLLVSMHCLE